MGDGQELDDLAGLQGRNRRDLPFSLCGRRDADASTTGFGRGAGTARDRVDLIGTGQELDLEIAVGPCRHGAAIRCENAVAHAVDVARNERDRRAHGSRGPGERDLTLDFDGVRVIYELVED